MKILIADHDVAGREVIGAGVRLAWPDSTLVLVSTVTAAIRAADEEEPDIVVLAADLGGRDGLAVVRELRKVSDVPILVLGLRDATDPAADEAAELRAFNLGADDYLSRPIRPLALVARIQAIERRVGLPPLEHAPPGFVAGDLTIDFASRGVALGGRPVKLTPLEYRLLYHLARNAGHVVPHPTLAERVWGHGTTSSPSDLKVFVSRVRSKIELPDRPHLIETVRGLGYRFVRP